MATNDVQVFRFLLLAARMKVGRSDGSEAFLRTL